MPKIIQLYPYYRLHHYKVISKNDYYFIVHEVGMSTHICLPKIHADIAINNGTGALYGEDLFIFI